jgi:hypothetical protein
MTSAAVTTKQARAVNKSTRFSPPTKEQQMSFAEQQQMASTSTSAFDEHQQWLASLRAMHARTTEPLPTAPLLWELLEPHDDVPLASGEFAEMALNDEDFDLPVYRSLAAASMFDAAPVELDDQDFDAPVYRSLTGFADHAAEAETPQFPSPQQAATVDDERAWLQTMPPLVSRQRAHGASILLG